MRWKRYDYHAAGFGAAIIVPLKGVRQLKLKIPPLVQVLIFGAGMYALSQLAPSFSVSIPLNSLLAVMSVLIGVAVAVMGVVEFRGARTTVDPRYPDKTEFLVMSGVYKFSRNPMYLGFLLILIGWFFVLSNVVAIVLLPVFVLYISHFQIKPEEQMLLKKFGDDFSQYCQKVRRWI